MDEKQVDEEILNSLKFIYNVMSIQMKKLQRIDKTLELILEAIQKSGNDNE